MSVQANGRAVILQQAAEELEGALSTANAGANSSTVTAQHAATLSRHQFSLSMSHRSTWLAQAVSASAERAKVLLEAASAKRREALSAAASDAPQHGRDENAYIHQLEGQRSRVRHIQNMPVLCQKVITAIASLPRNALRCRQYL